MVIQRREKVVDGKAKYQSFDVETHPKKKKGKNTFPTLGQSIDLQILRVLESVVKVFRFKFIGGQS